MSLPTRLQNLLDDLALFPDRNDRIQLLISIADGFQQSTRSKPYPEENRVPGCESEVFIFSEGSTADSLSLDIAVDNPQGLSAMALAQILKETLNGQSPRLALDIPEEIIYQIFGTELSMGKSGGLTNMIRMVHADAKRLLAS